MKEFIKKLLSENPDVSSIRVSLLTGLFYTGVVIGFILWLSVKYVSFGLDIIIVDKLIYLAFGISTIYVTGKGVSKLIEMIKKYKTEDKTDGNNTDK